MCVCLLWSTASVAQGPSASADQPVAKITAIYHKDRAIVLGDGSFDLALNTVVFNKRGKRANRYSLKPGQWVRCNARQQGGRWIVDELAVVPAPRRSGEPK